ncbi:protein-tyrosine phosphatase family protein [Vibrio cyclitrophicus]
MQDKHCVETAKMLMGIKGPAERLLFDSKRDRFNLSHSIKTSVRKDLNANFIETGDGCVAIATQYPYPYQIESQLQLLVDNRTPVLVVLASNNDIINDKLSSYFSISGKYGEIYTRSSHESSISLAGDIRVEIYQLEISGYKATVSVPVIHVNNWPDHQTIDFNTTLELVNIIESIASDKKNFYAKRNSRAVADPKRMLPVLHCRAGVGRTGQTIAAMIMRKNPRLSLPSIVKDLRISRNNQMIQTRTQMETLVILNQHLQRQWDRNEVVS